MKITFNNYSEQIKNVNKSKFTDDMKMADDKFSAFSKFYGKNDKITEMLDNHIRAVNKLVGDDPAKKTAKPSSKKDDKTNWSDIKDFNSKKDEDYLKNKKLEDVIYDITPEKIHVASEDTLYLSLRLLKSVGSKKGLVDLFQRINKKQKENPRVSINLKGKKQFIENNYKDYLSELDKAKAIFEQLRILAQRIKERGIHYGNVDDQVLNYAIKLGYELEKCNYRTSLIYKFENLKRTLKSAEHTLESNEKDSPQLTDITSRIKKISDKMTESDAVSLDVFKYDGHTYDEIKSLDELKSVIKNKKYRVFLDDDCVVVLDIIEKKYSSTEKKAAPAKSKEKPKANQSKTKTKPKQNQNKTKVQPKCKYDQHNYIEHYPEDVRLLKRFMGCIGKEKQRRTLLNIYRDLERRITEGKVNSKATHAKLVAEISGRLKKVLDKMAKSGITHVVLERNKSNDAFMAKVDTAIAGKKIRPSATLLKAYTGIEGAIKPDKAKVERLISRFQYALDHGRVCNSDLFWSEFEKAKSNMEKYIAGEITVIPVDPQKLNGLDTKKSAILDEILKNEGIRLSDLKKKFNASIHQGATHKSERAKSFLKDLHELIDLGVVIKYNDNDSLMYKVCDEYKKSMGLGK